MMTHYNIEAELSYAYLHAVAAKAGIGCQAASRALDNDGVDAILHLTKDFGEDAKLTEISLNVQLKATIAQPTPADNKLSYWLDDVALYNRLRTPTALPPKLLAVLFLPSKAEDWLTHTADALQLYRCAYWVSLVGAAATTNKSGQTIYFPTSQALSPGGLMELFGRVARQEKLTYAS